VDVLFFLCPLYPFPLLSVLSTCKLDEKIKGMKKVRTKKKIWIKKGHRILNITTAVKENLPEIKYSRN